LAARFTRSLGSLISSGTPITKALEIASRSTGNKFVERKLVQAIGRVLQGGEMSAAIREQNVFPPMVPNMISIGEDTGTMEEMLNQTSEYFEFESDEAIKAMTSMIEPIIILFMGAVIGTVVIAIMLPIFSMGDLAGV
jgi:type IV pilus assembly protein PilC